MPTSTHGAKGSQGENEYQFTERYLEPADFMVYLEFNPRDYEKYWIMLLGMKVGDALEISQVRTFYKEALEVLLSDIDEVRHIGLFRIYREHLSFKISRYRIESFKRATACCNASFPSSIIS